MSDVKQKLVRVLQKAVFNGEVLADEILSKFDVAEKKPQFSVSHGRDRVLVVDGSGSSAYAIADFAVYRLVGYQDEKTASERATRLCNLLNSKEPK